MKTVFIRPERCIGCKHCEIACAIEHSKSKELFTAILEEPTPAPRIHVLPTIGIMTFPDKCRHCNPAPCMQVCPTGAITRNKEIDTVLINGNRCIACGMCGIVCPFDAISYKRSWEISIEREVALKCDNCVDRLMKGFEPACVGACKTNALSWGEIEEVMREERKKIAEKIAIATTSAEELLEKPVPENIKLWRDLGLVIKKLGEKG